MQLKNDLSFARYRFNSSVVAPAPASVSHASQMGHGLPNPRPHVIQRDELPGTSKWESRFT